MRFASLLQGPEGKEEAIRGLTQAEAEARYVEGQDNSIAYKEGRSRREIVREAIFNVHTFDLLGVGVVFFLLDQPLSAFFSLVIMGLIFGWNISHAFRAKDKLDLLLEQTAPEASLIRGGALRAVDPDEIVPGDAVVVGPGDQFFADGRLLTDDPISINHSLLDGNPRPQSLQQEDPVLAGSYCISGHGIYEAEVVGNERQVTVVLEKSILRQQPPTPLQKITGRVLAIMRILVFVLGSYIILSFILFDRDPALRTTYENALSIILGLAPGGIYFMILLTYISASAEIANAGAIVPRAETVETLAQTDVLCVGKGGTLTGMLVDFNPVEETGEVDMFSQSRVQQILGDFARSTRSRSKLMQAMRASFDGTRRKPLEDALFLSLAGWQGIVFDDEDLEGTYILGFESALATRLDWIGIMRREEGSSRSAAGEDTGMTEFIFTYSPQLKRLRSPNGRPRLPERLIPLGYLQFSEEVRPEAEETVDAFTEGGIALKVLSSQGEEQVVPVIDEIGITNADGSAADHLSGLELAGLPPDAFAEAAAKTEVFGALTPDQKRDIVLSLKDQEALVTMVGDSVADLSAQVEANLSVTFRGSSQAAHSIADVILLDDTLSTLPSILQTGQAIFNRLFDVIKLTLAHVVTAVLLTLIAFVAGANYFPYLPAQNTIITLLTITLPSIGLSFWLQPGQIRTNGLGKKLAFFVLPAGISVAIFVLITYFLFQYLTGNLFYARVVVTHLLMGTGLLLVVFVQPPTKFWVGGDELSSDKRPGRFAVVLLFLFIFLSIVPYTSELLGIQRLRPTEHYLFVAVILSIWVLMLRGLWRADWFRRLTGIAALEETVPPWLQ
jgi:cation-transporting P-type ATPase E